MLDRLRVLPVYVRQILLMARYYRNQQDLPAILAFDDLNRHLPLTATSVEAMLARSPACREAANARLLSFDVDLPRFRALPLGTVGRQWADHLDAEGFEPIVFTPGLFSVETDADWVIARLRQLHDLVHVVTGFGTDEAGEAGLQAFNFAQMQNTMAAIGLAGLLVAFLAEPYDAARIRAAMDAIARGWLMGRDADPLLAVDWNAWWARPVTELRAHLSVVALDAPHRLAA